jgi:hypothetical protein
VTSEYDWFSVREYLLLTGSFSVREEEITLGDP